MNTIFNQEFAPVKYIFYIFYFIFFSIFMFCYKTKAKTGQVTRAFIEKASTGLLVFLTLLTLFCFFIKTNSLISFADGVFLVLFLSIVPITFTLLVRNEKLSTFFCFSNFIFLFFVVFFLISTNDLVGLVMGYELLFLPAFLIMRRTVYSAAAQSAYSVFTVWSVLGSLLVVSATIFVVIKNSSTSLSCINFSNWSKSEVWLISLLFFFGFGVKIPIWPFHYWLARVHVEASTGFSIFLSGFLVKGAVYVCWKTMWSLGMLEPHPILICFCFFSVLDAVLKLSIQTDIKKLVAFTTVFEMGLIYFFLMWKPATSFYYVFVFSFSHAFLSALMFYLVEVIYTKTHSRSVDAMSGISVFFPILTKIMWGTLFIFWGLPFTLKFSIEVWVILSTYLTGSVIIFIFLIFILLLANIAVTKTWFNIFYGSPQKNLINNDVTSFEFCVFMYFIAANVVSLFLFNF